MPSSSPMGFIVRLSSDGLYLCALNLHKQTLQTAKNYTVLLCRLWWFWFFIYRLQFIKPFYAALTIDKIIATSQLLNDITFSTDFLLACRNITDDGQVFGTQNKILYHQMHRLSNFNFSFVQSLSRCARLNLYNCVLDENPTHIGFDREKT